MFTHSGRNGYRHTDASALGRGNPENVIKWKNDFGESVILIPCPKTFDDVNDRDQRRLAIAKLRQAEIEEEAVYELRRLELERKFSKAKREVEIFYLQTLVEKKAEQICPNVTVRNSVTVRRPIAGFANSQVSLMTQPTPSDTVCSLDLSSLELPSFTSDQTGPLDLDLGTSIANADVHSQSIEDLSQCLHTADRRDVRCGVACSSEGKTGRTGISNPITLTKGHSGIGLPCRKTNRELLNSWAPATRRVTLSYVSPSYDPLRLVAPIFQQANVSLQEFCRDNLGWKDEIPENNSKRWRYRLGNLIILRELLVARLVRPADSVSATPSGLRRFSGASETGCGFASYARRRLVTRSFLWSLVRYNLCVVSLKANLALRLGLTVAYLPSLQYRLKGFRKIRNLKRGDVVIIASDFLSRAYWRLGRVAALHPGTDGVVRKLTLKTMTGVVLQDVRKICLFEVLDKHGSNANGQPKRD